jgi:predicted enzyme related to lactoylglutathione lyase
MDLGKSKRFYAALLGTRGRQVAAGRVYFDAGPVILGILDYSSALPGERPKTTEAIYLTTRNLDELHLRASKLGCLDRGLIHGDPANPAGEVVVRPWGERSFYAHDPSGNSLCFVDERTKFTGTPQQISSLARRARVSGPAPPSRPPPRTRTPRRRGRRKQER